MCNPCFWKKMNDFVTLINWNMMGKSGLVKRKSPQGCLLTTYVTPKTIKFADLKNTINVCHEK